MAYGERNVWSEYLGATLANTLNFRGRATRTEGVIYLLVSILIEASITFALNVPNLASDSLQMWLVDILAVALQIPLVSWFVRRLHDQGRSGLFVLIVPIGWLIDWRVEGLLHSVIILPLVGVLFALFFWTPQPGENRFGPDPRLGQPDEPLAQRV